MSLYNIISRDTGTLINKTRAEKLNWQEAETALKNVVETLKKETGLPIQRIDKKRIDLLGSNYVIKVFIEEVEEE